MSLESSAGLHGPLFTWLLSQHGARPFPISPTLSSLGDNEVEDEDEAADGTNTLCEGARDTTQEKPSKFSLHLSPPSRHFIQMERERGWMRIEKD